MPDRAPIEPALIDQPTADAIFHGRMGDPFSVLGPHEALATGPVIRAFIPGARAVAALDRRSRDELCRLHETAVPGMYVGRPARTVPYLLQIEWPGGTQETEDPYSFGVVISDFDLHLFSEGSHWRLPQQFGASPIMFEGVQGVRFAVWAPNASRVSVVGDFNSWDGRRHPMRLRPQAGIWELFVPRLRAGERYKFEIVDRAGSILPQKADPLARATEKPPSTASVVADTLIFAWNDDAWMRTRGERQSPGRPISIYEVHVGSWARPPEDPSDTLNWERLAERLIPYVKAHGFSHIEFLPIMEHPFTGSWGYQPLSQFAPSARFGSPEALARFVDTCHREDIGVILDWVPAHFPTDPHGLARFDGTALYEHADPREGFHRDWNTYIFNVGRSEVQGFLIASALYWLEVFHADGLRVDAVASMLYRDYSRAQGDWIPNQYGGRENLESIDFLRRLNSTVRERCPGAITIAEESTAWPGVTSPPDQGGLGFSYKWNMGWMHDTLSFLSRDPVHRSWHHNELTFGLLYAFSERFVLPLSHDEVVHGKGSLYGRAPGSEWDKLATLRAYYSFMWTHPGKKLLFMGGELGQRHEWNHDGEIDWELLKHSGHAGLNRLVRDLNALYRQQPALYAKDSDPSGFEWITRDDSTNSAFAYLRTADEGEPIIVVVNFTPVGRERYRIGLPWSGAYREILNTDASIYGGANRGNYGGVIADPVPSHGRPYSADLYLPPLAALILQHQR